MLRKFDDAITPITNDGLLKVGRTNAQLL